MRIPALLLPLPLLAQGTQAPRPGGPGRPAQARPQGPGLPGPGGGGAFRGAFDLGSSVHRLWVRNVTLSPGWSRRDPEMRLLWNEELRLDTPSEAQVQALWGREGWNLEDPRVVLVGAEDRVITSWGGEPRPEEVLSALKGSGWTSRLSRLEDFLREHPDQGQARLGQIQVLANRMRRLDPEAEPLLSASNAAALEIALERLRELPDWPRQVPGPLWSAQLRGLFDRPNAPLAPDLRRRLREDVEEALVRDPAQPSLWFLWSLFATAPTEGETLIARLPKLPGQALLPAAAVQPLVAFHLRSGGASALESLATRIIPETTTWSADAAWRAARVAALFGQRRKEEAFRTLESDQEALPDVGFTGRVMALFPLLQAPEGEEPYLTPADRTRMFTTLQEGRQLAQAKARAKRMDDTEEEPVLRFELGGAPAWGRAWATLPTHPAFDDWGPSELAFGRLEEQAWQALRSRQGWGPEPRWILRKGEVVFESGTEAPTAAAFADLALRQGEPRLAQLRRTLKAHPDLLAARRLRLQLLRERMPHPRLEALLLEDAQKVAEPFAEEAFKPLPELWGGPARRKALALEQSLGHWPQDTSAWLAWLDWSRIAGRGDAASLLQQLPQPPLEPGEEGPLPTSVGSAIAERLLAQGRLQELASFGRLFWAHLQPRLAQAAQVAERSRPTPNRGPSPEDINRMIQGQMALGQIRGALNLLRPWTQALRATGQGPEADTVGAALEAIQPGLGQRLAEGGRRNPPPPTAPSRPAPPAGGSPPR